MSGVARYRFRSSWCNAMVVNDLDGRAMLYLTMGGTFRVWGGIGECRLAYRSHGMGD